MNFSIAFLFLIIFQTSTFTSTTMTVLSNILDGNTNATIQIDQVQNITRISLQTTRDLSKGWKVTFVTSAKFVSVDGFSMSVQENINSTSTSSTSETTSNPSTTVTVTNRNKISGFASFGFLDGLDLILKSSSQSQLSDIRQLSISTIANNAGSTGGGGGGQDSAVQIVSSQVSVDWIIQNITDTQVTIQIQLSNTIDTPTQWLIFPQLSSSGLTIQSSNCSYTTTLNNEISLKMTSGPGDSVAGALVRFARSQQVNNQVIAPPSYFHLQTPSAIDLNGNMITMQISPDNVLFCLYKCT